MKASILGILIANFLYAGPLFAQREGTTSSGGGTACENAIKKVRDKLAFWIRDPVQPYIQLKFGYGGSADRYYRNMLEVLATGQDKEGRPTNAVNVVCQHSPVMIDGVEKVCTQSTFNDGSREVRCFYDAIVDLERLNPGELVRQVHHEYVQLAGFEQPNGSISNYNLSNQITGYPGSGYPGYLVYVTEVKLNVTPNKQSRIKRIPMVISETASKALVMEQNDNEKRYKICDFGHYKFRINSEVYGYLNSPSAQCKDLNSTSFRLEDAKASSHIDEQFALAFSDGLNQRNRNKMYTTTAISVLAAVSAPILTYCGVGLFKEARPRHGETSRSDAFGRLLWRGMGLATFGGAITVGITAGISAVQIGELLEQPAVTVESALKQFKLENPMLESEDVRPMDIFSTIMDALDKATRAADARLNQA